MKKQTLFLLLISLIAIGFSGCAVTGNPNQGGIFWSEDMAQDRLAQRESALSSIERDTAEREHSSRQMERQLGER
jgi:hypothetical protein